MQEGFSGKIAKAFIGSKLTILLMVAFLLIGGYSTFLIPREEEPQIEVPIADIFRILWSQKILGDEERSR